MVRGRFCVHVAAGVAVAFFLVDSGRPAYGQATVPAGFEDAHVAAVSSPTSLAVVPDGRMLIGSQFGQVYVYQNGSLVQPAALDLGSIVCSYRERGLTGLAVDPDFASNRYVYVSYNFNKYDVECSREHDGAPVGRVSRFQMNGNQISRASERVLLDNIPSPIGVHNLGDVEFGADGYLYVGVGDGGCDYLIDSGCFDSNDAARDLNALVGKVLRITRDGGIPPGNPFTGSGSVRCNVNGGGPSGSVCQEIFATGLRNPWRLAFDPNASGTRFFINDVGQDTWEEIDEGVAGADYGWNMREGFCANTSTSNCSQTPPSGLRNPVFAYGRGDGCSAITGGAFVRNGTWPAAFDGAYMFSDYVCGIIFKLVPGGDGSFTRQTFATGVNSPTDLYFAPYNGGMALYYTSFGNGGAVRRIAHVGGANRAPTAAFTAAPVSGPPPLVVDFDGSGSSDPDGGTLTYVWTFGDGTADYGRTVRHTYSTAGTFTATLRVTDPQGASVTATRRIDVGNTAPQPTIVTPTAGHRFAVGDTIVLRGHATDAEDGDLPNSSLTWQVIRRHNTHTHPFLPPTVGNDISFPAPGPENLGAGGTSSLEVQLTATDSRGQTTTITQALMPRTVRLDFLSEPAGAVLRIENEQVTTPISFVSWERHGVVVAAASQAGADGATLTFTSWSDGGAATHTIVTPASPSSYTARFTRQPTNGGGGTATASSVENANYAAVNAIDGNRETRWSSAFSDPQWIRLDLGAPTEIDRVMLEWTGAYGRAYQIQVSNDGQTWTTVFQTSSGDGGIDDIGPLSARGRFVRMYGTARATQWGYSLREFKVIRAPSLAFNGTADLVWQHQTEGWVSLWQMNGTVMQRGALLTPSQVTDTDWKIVGTGDFSGDGRTDVLWHHQSSGSISVWLMNGTNQVRGLSVVPDRVADTNWRIVATGDFNGDGQRDIVWHHRTEGWVSVWLMHGLLLDDGVLLSPSRVADTSWRVVGAGDFNGDRRTDLVWHNLETGHISIWLMDGLRLTAGVWVTPNQVADTNWRIRAVADVNADGKPDLIWQHGASGALSAWIMSGTTLVSGTSLTPDAVADLNWRLVGPK